MVQLPATHAIEYVAAGHFFPGGLFPWGLFLGRLFPRRSFARGHFWPGVFCPGDFFSGGLLPRALLAGGLFVREGFCPGVFCPGGLLSGGLMPVSPNFNAYTHRLGFLCLAWSMFILLVAVYSWPSRSVTDKQNKKLSYCWETVRCESMPRIAEMDVEMKT